MHLQPTRGVGAAAPRVATRGQGTPHRRWGSGFPHDSGSIGSLGAGPMMPRRLMRRRAVRRPPKIVAMAHQHAWNPTRGVGATALRCATCCDKARHNRCDSEFFVVPGSTGSVATGTTNWGRVGRHRPAQRRAQARCTNVAWRREGRALWAPTETWCLYHYTGHGQIFWGCQRKVLNATRRRAGGMRTRTRGSQPHLRRRGGDWCGGKAIRHRPAKDIESTRTFSSAGKRRVFALG